jgi:WD40 repeat protein
MDDEFGDASHSSSPTTPSSSLLTCAFNQDGGCLAVGTTSGFSVHNLHPQYSVSVDRPLRGGIGQVEMLFRCNLMALVGGGPSPHSAPHRVLIWDDHLPKEIGELSFRQAVLSVKLRKDAIAVALRDRVYVYHLADLSLRDKIYTADNPHGLLTLSTQVQDMVLACPSVTTGHVRVELYGLRKTVLLEAHDGQLRGLCLTASGSLLATASAKGTVIRVWNVANQTCVHEFRRGVERATITCLAFSWDDQWLGCCSDKGTAHVFFCNPQKQQDQKTKASFTKRLLFQSSETKSVCQIRGIPHPLACAFVGDAQPNILAVAGWDADGNGVLLQSEFAAHQEARRVAYHVLVKNGVEETEEERRRRRARGAIGFSKPKGAVKAKAVFRS